MFAHCRNSWATGFVHRLILQLRSTSFAVWLVFSMPQLEHIKAAAKLMQVAHLFLCLALNLFGDLGDGLAAVALAGSHKAGEVAPVPVAETLLQQLLPLLGLCFSEGQRVCGGGGNLCRYSLVAGTLQVQPGLC